VIFSLGNKNYRKARELTADLRKMLDKFPHKWIKALDDAGDIAQKFLDLQFYEEGYEFETHWRSLALATQKDRARKGYRPEHPVLVRRGWLRASVVSKTSKNAKRVTSHRGIVLYSTLQTKSGLNMVKLHQKGGKYLPARKIYKEGNPPFISERGWKEIKVRFTGMFYEIRRELES